MRVRVRARVGGGARARARHQLDAEHGVVVADHPSRAAAVARVVDAQLARDRARDQQRRVAHPLQLDHPRAVLADVAQPEGVEVPYA